MKASLAAWMASAVALACAAPGCSLVRNPDDFTIVADGGTDGDGGSGVDAGPEDCNDATDCEGAPNVVYECVDRTCRFVGCADGFDDCNGTLADGCEVDTRADVSHCGGCGMACSFANAVAACEGSACAIASCMTGFDDCDGETTNGCEASLDAATSCGSCTTTCAMGELCDTSMGSAACSSTCDATICGTSCVDTTMNVNHCGGCDMACDTTNVVTVSCVSSSCEIGACVAGFADCDGDPDNGCEATPATDGMNCGACGVVCEGGAACVAGRCDPVASGAIDIGHGCVVRESGRVYCWGRNNWGQAGLGVRAPERPTLMPESTAAGAPALRATRVAVGGAHTCVIGLDGAVRCWGFNGDGALGRGNTMSTRDPTPIAVPAGTSFVDIDADYGTTCAIATTGDVWCWGPNPAGGIGVPSTTNPVTTPNRVALSRAARDVAVGNNTVCALLDDDTVSCWGGDDRGQLGNGGADLMGTSTPVQVMGITNARRLLGHIKTFCVLDSGGGLSCWGDNVSGQLGPRSPRDYEPSPVVVEASGVLDAWLSNGALCFRTSAGVSCKGRNLEGQFGNRLHTPINQNGDPPVRVPALDDLRTTFSSFFGGCGLTADRGLRCFGASFEGQIPRDTLYRDEPTPVLDETGGMVSGFSNVALGPFHACAVSGTRTLFCWGSNEFQKAGTGYSVSHPRQVMGVSDVRDVAAGRDHTCVIENAGTRQVYCFGSNGFLQLGMTGASTSTPTAVDVPGGEEIAVSAGTHHTCAIQETTPGSGSGTVWCWGRNHLGQCGRDTAGANATVAQVPGITDAIAIAAGAEMTCALRATGAVSCWGANTVGSLGDGTTTSSTSPVIVSGITNATAIEAGLNHACALLSTGGVKCWGRGSAGELGNGARTSSSTPVDVMLGGVAATSVAAGEGHTCATMMDGSVRCWGSNGFGQLGTGTMMEDRPVTVPMVSGATRVRAGGAGGYTTCAERTGGTITCWGSDVQGTCGSGDSLYFTPYDVVMP